MFSTLIFLMIKESLSAVSESLKTFVIIFKS